MLLTMLLFIAEGVLFMGLSVPLIQRRVGPNPYYGFRVPKTLGDSRIWYDVNLYAGRQLFRAGVATTVAAVALRFVPGITTTYYALGCAGVLACGALLAVWLGVRYLRTL